ncbi:putative acyltransferase [Exophiala dermatitidis]
MPVAKPGLEPAAGFSLESPANRPDRVPLKKGEYSIASRTLALSTYFLSGALAINLSQFLGAPLYLVNQDWYNAWIAFTKQSFGLLTMTLTQTFAPTKVIISGDASVRGQLLQSTEGDLILNFPERLVLIANHQIYTDWLYLWWIAYCNGMHGRLYIILKESLKKIPVLGWGMQFNQFIFLKRKWEQDKPNMASALQRLNKPTDPMWLLLFPEGTNLAVSTRAKSAAWAAKNNIPDMKHVLLPRSTGLHFCLEELKGTVDYVYDCTIAYEGVPRGAYAQDIFTLKAGYLEGRPPKSVSMHWRRFAIKDIPLHNEKVFELWLIARWREKDLLMEQYLQTGSFPADKGATKYKSGKVLRGCGHMEVPIRASRWYEFLQIFAPMGILAMVLYIFYGDLPQRFWKNINKQALQSGTDDIKQAGIKAGKGAKSVSNSLSGLTLDSFFEPTKQEEGFKAGAMAVQKLLNSPSAQTLLSRADFIQQFLSDPQKMVTDSITSQQQNFMRQLAMEEARRQQSRISAPAVGPVRQVTTNGTLTQKGTFWDALEAEEKSRHGSIVSAPSSTTNRKSKGTFWQELKAAEEKKGAPRLTEAAKQSLGGQKKGTFWDDIKAEEDSRHGTVVTLSSNASTAVASDSSTSTRRAAPKLGTSRAASTAQPARPLNKALSTTASTVSSQQTRPASSTKPKAATVQQAKGNSTGPKSVSKPASSRPARSTPASNTSAKPKSALPSSAPPVSKPLSTKTSNAKTNTSNTKTVSSAKSNGISKTPTVTNKKAGTQPSSTRPEKKSTTISGTNPKPKPASQKQNTNLQTASNSTPPKQGKPNTTKTTPDTTTKTISSGPPKLKS